MKRWRKFVFSLAILAVMGPLAVGQAPMSKEPADPDVAPIRLPASSTKSPVGIVETVEVYPAGAKVPDLKPANPYLGPPSLSCPGGNCGDGQCIAIEEHYPCPTVYGFGDFLYLTARGADLPYAQPRDGVGPLSVPMGPVAIVDPDYSAGFRVGGGVRVGEGSFVQGTLTWWENSSNDSITAPAGTVLRSLIVFPATLNAAADSLAATSRQDFNVRLGDVDFRHILIEGKNHYFGYILGGRYAHLTQDSRSDFSILGATTVTTNIDFDGVGARAGLEGEYSIKGGLYTYGRGVLSAVAGHFGSNYRQQNVLAGVQASTSASEDRVVPILDFEVGAGWSNSNGRFRVQAGYFLSSWHNTLTTPSFIQSVQNTNFTTNSNNARDTLTFDGFTFRVEVRY